MQNLCSFEITTNDKSHDFLTDYHDFLVFFLLCTPMTPIVLKACGEISQILSFLLTLFYRVSGSATAVTVS